MSEQPNHQVEANSDSNESASLKTKIIKWSSLTLLIYGILVAVSLIGAGFQTATHGEADKLFSFAQNPILGLIIGMTATALIQSSSTVSSIVVGLVAGGLPIATAIPMIMGANIGTSITNTFVSLGHIRSKEEFKKAFAGATIHDFFNLISVAIFLPLEIMFGMLEYLSDKLVHLFVGGDSLSISGFNIVKAVTKPAVGVIETGIETLPGPFAGIIMIVVGVAMIIGCITFIGKLLKSLMVGKAKTILHNALGRGPVSGIASGTVVTILVQSSSTTTSLAVPLVGTGLFKIRDIYPFTLGANIGTCITALLSATAVTGEYAVFALQIALVHLLYNIIGVLVVYGLPFLREIPIKLATGLGEKAAENKLYAFAYIGGVFFLTPALLILAYQ